MSEPSTVFLWENHEGKIIDPDFQVGAIDMDVGERCENVDLHESK